ncbi:ribbon-helix-helix protein, CopG family [Hankyongella ginsenosidimutans]|uniref:Ribbon-helix-helix protein, CopG family n=1 Tax=Hankyongella ginsenosidimutans TaxID=1763828 RepID=A0A4D7BVG0_9SPHN|nr:toxin-antitoxin system HicB family antitoxin [Hankyongella ginsenosidimutans]QCI79509.1 ribbon-helix-helix protein, CopG family [Hankyongella ginsenosidimutans]TXG84316.1 MAG: ribbon-helix-helix protein, CopG family [Sphingomonadales bacterium]
MARPHLGPRRSYPLRLDPALLAAIERLAAAEIRSVNGQIEALLREALVARGIGVKAGEDDAAPRGDPP